MARPESADVNLDELPADHGDAVAEVRACRKSAALFEFRFIARARLTGPGALPLLERFASRRLGDLAPGPARPGARRRPATPPRALARHGLSGALRHKDRLPAAAALVRSVATGVTACTVAGRALTIRANYGHARFPALVYQVISTITWTACGPPA